MATSNKTLQFLRNGKVFESHDAALTALEAQLKAAPDGSPVIARYNTTVEEGGQPKTKVRTLFGISGQGADQYEIFDNQGKNDAIDTAIEDLIGGAGEGFNTLKGIQDKIEAMDLTAVGGGDGDIITGVSETDGKVTASTKPLSDIELTGYSKTSATGAIAATDTLENALSKLENTVGANKISNADKSIVVTEPTEGATTTDIKVNIKSDEKVIKLGNDGIYTNLNLVKITGETLPATVKERYEFRDSDNNKIGEAIDIAKDSHIVSITYDETTQKLIYKYVDANGAEQTTEVDMAHLILETEVENGIQSVQGKLSIKLDTTGDDTGEGKFLSVGADGLKLDGITDAIAAAVNALDVTDAAVAGQYVSSVSETDGKIAVARLNVSDAVLNGYEKGTKPASTAIAATDDVKGAIAKLEHQIDAAKAAATTKVVEGTDAGNNLEISSATSATDGSTTYTINLTDVASKTALDAEIAARKAVDGQNGDTYAANTSANYINDATSLNDADVKLDAELKTVDDAMLTGVAKGNGIDVTTKSNKSQTISAVAVDNDPIIQVTESGIGTKEDAVFNCGTY